MTKFMILRHYDGVADAGGWGPYDTSDEACAAALVLLRKDLAGLKEWEIANRGAASEYVVDETDLRFGPPDTDDNQVEFIIVPMTLPEEAE